MNVAHLDCNAGISGNMFLGALIDLGFPVELLRSELKKLPLPIPDFKLEKVSKKGIAATFFDTELVPEHHHRRLSEIRNLITEAGYSKFVADRAQACFNCLAEAEAKIHGVSIDEIHFHEVGAVDAIVDIVGACLGIEYFQIRQITTSPIRVGFGSVKCAHGEIPIPAPAALELLTNFQIFSGVYEGEWTTPTGAAILKVFATPDSIPRMTVTKIGYGAGAADRPIPNIHRIVLGKSVQIEEQDYQVVLETNIDELNPEIFGFLGEAILQAGARDYYFTPVQMKKGRPGVLVTVIAPPEKVAPIEELLFSQTSTFGIRKYPGERHCLRRDYRTIMVDGCEIRVKMGFQNGRVVKYAPEYNDCLLAAATLKRPLKDIYDEANFQFRKMFFDEGSR
ncbi:MAG: nickel pincer cofactor biosynthesis protein LarC [Firmicutes bacterium]|nr:nickel pincer cofactor biosynthesis protein LarC [Bacillota bacterium]